MFVTSLKKSLVLISSKYSPMKGHLRQQLFCLKITASKSLDGTVTCLFPLLLVSAQCNVTEGVGSQWITIYSSTSCTHSPSHHWLWYNRIIILYRKRFLPRNVGVYTTITAALDRQGEEVLGVGLEWAPEAEPGEWAAEPAIMTEVKRLKRMFIVEVKRKKNTVTD